MASFRDWFRRDHEVTEAAKATKALTPAQLPARQGYEYGIPRGGLNEYSSGLGEATNTDRRSQLQQLYESFLACPWAWSSVQAIARTITAGGLVTDWDADTQEGTDEEPDKPENVVALERLLAFVNPDQDIRQVMRNAVTDLLVFGDAYLEVTWWGRLPVALYNLDNPTTTPITDEHGVISGFVQNTEYGQRVQFSPDEVIHISLDAPRSGVFGVSPTQAALLPITAWLFAAATSKEMFRKGLPPTIHADFPAGVSKSDQELWVAQTMSRNVGPRNIGRPFVTKGGAKLTELQAGKVQDASSFLDQKRDEIIACVTPGTKIVTAAGLVAVEEMRPGMRVLTHTGNWKHVTEVLVNPVYAPVMEIKANSFAPLQATANHPVWAASYKQDRNHGHHLAGHFWVPAGEIRPRVRGRRGGSDALTLPQLDFSGSSEVLHLPDYVRLGARNTSPEAFGGRSWVAQHAYDDGEYIRHTSTRVHPIRSHVKMTRELGRLLGLYLAEGHTVNDSGVCWSFHEDETHLQDEVRTALASVFGLRNVSFKHTPEGKCINVLVRSAFLVELFKCGTALTKRLPEWAWNHGGAEFFEGVLSGWADGDGHVEHVNGVRGGARQRVSTRSETMAWQMRVIAVTLGLPATVAAHERPDDVGRMIRGRVLRSNGPAYEVSWPLDPQREGTYRIEGGTLTSPVRSAVQVDYDGLVYNLEVEDDNSYVTTSGTVHNCYGVPPAKLGIIEAGNLGGGTGTSQDKTFKINTCMPIAELILEKINFAITRQGFGIEGWHLKFRDVDYRDDKVIEDIRDMRLRNGAWILDRYRADIGEPPVEGGDQAVLVDRQNLVLWKDMARMSEAMVDSKGAGAAMGMQMQDQPPGQQAPPAPKDDKGAEDGQEPPSESVAPYALARYRRRLNEALTAMSGLSEAAAGAAGAVYAQLAKGFPPAAIAWVKDDADGWQGPRTIPLDQIDTNDRDQWDASRQRDKPHVARARKKLRRKTAAGKHVKPIVLIRWPGAKKWVIADGHHRFLAAEDEGHDGVWAFTGRVPKEDGDWQVMAASEDRLRGKKAA